MPAHPKVVAVLAFAVTVVLTPIQRWPVFIAYLMLLVAIALWLQLPLKLFFTRALIEVPFVFFAVLMPLFGQGQTVHLGPIRLYAAGLIAGASILAKGTLGVLAAVLLSTTTTARDLLRGLSRLKLPVLMVEIASFMLRYVNVVNDEMERMKVARESRGFSATGIQHWRVIANAAGALFIRSYERGERVHLAMVSRGYTGSLPELEDVRASRMDWLRALMLPGSAILLSALGGLFL